MPFRWLQEQAEGELLKAQQQVQTPSSDSSDSQNLAATLQLPENANFNTNRSPLIGTSSKSWPCAHEWKKYGNPKGTRELDDLTVR